MRPGKARTTQKKVWSGGWGESEPTVQSKPGGKGSVLLKKGSLIIPYKKRAPTAGGLQKRGSSGKGQPSELDRKVHAKHRGERLKGKEVGGEAGEKKF